MEPKDPEKNSRTRSAAVFFVTYMVFVDPDYSLILILKVTSRTPVPPFRFT